MAESLNDYSPFESFDSYASFQRLDEYPNQPEIVEFPMTELEKSEMSMYEALAYAEVQRVQMEAEAMAPIGSSATATFEVPVEQIQSFAEWIANQGFQLQLHINR